MKKLFVSLLRLGDLILQKPLIDSAGCGSEIHLLINDEFRQAAELYPEYHFHFFPRKALQNLINQPETSLFAPFEELRLFMQGLNQINFTEVVNLTHNRISAYVLDQIDAPIKRGLEFKNDHFKAFESQWQKLFNLEFSENKRASMHYLAALAKSLDLCIPKVMAIEDRSKANEVYLQVLTSDEKKNWSLENWKLMFNRLQKMKPDWNIKVLCSESEVHKVSQYFNSHQIDVCSLKEVREKLKAARFLISGDTSIAHLAAEVRTPSLILSLGSSDYTKTTPWVHGNWILTSEISCSPCPHSRPCQKFQHECSDALRVSTVLSVINGMDRDQYFFSVGKPEFIYRSEFDFEIGLRTKNYSSVEGQHVSRDSEVL